MENANKPQTVADTACDIAVLFTQTIITQHGYDGKVDSARDSA